MLLGTKELQNRLHISRDLSYTLMRSSFFPSMKLGGRYYVAEKALENWIAKNENNEIKL